MRNAFGKPPSTMALGLIVITVASWGPCPDLLPEVRTDPEEGWWCTNYPVDKDWGDHNKRTYCAVYTCLASSMDCTWTSGPKCSCVS